MLTAIKERAQGLIAWVIVLLITVPFALWGINAYFENQGRVVVAEVEGEEITYDAFRNRYDTERRQMQEFLRGRFDPSMTDSLEFKRQLLERMITEQLVTRYTVDEGYRISDAQLNEFIRSRREFQEEGKFSSQRYEQVRRALNLRDEAAFEAELRRGNMVQQLANGFGETVFVTPADRERLLSLTLQTRKFDYAVLTPERFIDKVEVSAQEVEDYYKANAARFRQPDQVRVAWIRLTLDDVARDFEASEQEVRAAYQENIDRYKVDQRRARHILLPVPTGASAEDAQKIEQQARKLADEARAGADFAQLARDHSQDTGTREKGGDLGFVVRGATDPAFDRALFALEPGAISAPVRSAFGYHVIQVVEERKVVDKDFASVRKDIEREISRRKAADRFHELSVRFADLVYETPENLDAAASELGLKVQESGWFGRAGGEGLMREPKVLKAAFSDEVLAENHNSELLEIEPDVLVALRKLEYRESVVRPLDQVRSEVEKSLRQEKAVARVAAEGETLLGKLRDGADFAATLAAGQWPVQSPEAVRRSGTAEINPRVVAAAFAAPRPVEGGASYTGLALENGGYALVRVNRVTDGDPASADTRTRAQVEAQLRDRRGAQYFDAMQDDLRKAAKVTIYAERL